MNQAPLAERMRPRNLQEFCGQGHLVGVGKVLDNLITMDRVPSLIFWGPPGTGKTTLARIIALETKANFVEMSAVSTGVKDIRAVIKQAQADKEKKIRTILFLDEIHRFSKGQQDAFLPSVEDGTVVLIGATTENPSFRINNALLSRCRTFVLEDLSDEDLYRIIDSALSDKERGLGREQVQISPVDKKYLVALSGGDARTMLNALEMAAKLAGKKKKITRQHIEQALQKSNLYYDRVGDEHYNIISALHKSMRGGDANAALYYMGRMLAGGEDPLYIARRVVRFASEDIGLANSQALAQALAAYDACRFIGMPECGVNLAQAVVYMAMSPKSVALYDAYETVMADIKQTGNLSVPLHLRNAPTKLMGELGYGKDYKYTPKASKDENDEQTFLPPELQDKQWIKIKKKK